MNGFLNFMGGGGDMGGKPYNPGQQFGYPYQPAPPGQPSQSLPTQPAPPGQPTPTPPMPRGNPTMYGGGSSMINPGTIYQRRRDGQPPFTASNPIMHPLMRSWLNFIMQYGR